MHKIVCQYAVAFSKPRQYLFEVLKYLHDHLEVFRLLYYKILQNIGKKNSLFLRHYTVDAVTTQIDSQRCPAPLPVVWNMYLFYWYGNNHCRA